MVTKEQKRIYQKHWLEKGNNKERYRLTTNQCRKEWIKRNPEKVKAAKKRYRIKHGISPRITKVHIDIYNPLFQAQDGKCAICGNLPNGKRLAIDHNHQNGKIRGLLCSYCNLALGLFQDSITNLSRVIGYLEKS